MSVCGLRLANEYERIIFKVGRQQKPAHSSVFPVYTGINRPMTVSAFHRCGVPCIHRDKPEELATFGLIELDYDNEYVEIWKDNFNAFKLFKDMST